MGNLFKKGYAPAREEKKRQDENRENMGKKLWRLFLSDDGDEAEIRFLTEEPINFDEHTVKTMRGGKEKYDSVICTRAIGSCPLCEEGDRPSFKGAFLVYDYRPFEYKDEKTGKKKKTKGQLRIYVAGIKVLSQLDRLSQRYGLTKRNYIMSRSGSGTQTTYMFDRVDKVSKLTKEEIAEMLPEKLREEYDGTQESLYAILEAQLSLLAEEAMRGRDDDDDDEDEAPRKKSKKNTRIVHADDDDEDEDDDDDEDEDDDIGYDEDDDDDEALDDDDDLPSDGDDEEDEPRHRNVKGKSLKSSKPTKSLFKSGKSVKETSMKKSAKTILRKK